jgi:hypothetical protein
MVKRNQRPGRIDPEVRTVDDLPLWLRDKIETQCVAWRVGQLRHCDHNPRPDGRIPAHMCAWKPDLVTCPRCIHLATVARHSEAARRCDRCNRVTAGTDQDHVVSALVHLPRLTYGIAVCLSCRESAA